MACDPVGIPEIAERLRVKRPTVDVWRTRGLLPEPRWTVGGRPAWNWSDIQTWAKDTARL
jgi:predicted DNA-binding transcriptional regulator AlpA